MDASHNVAGRMGAAVQRGYGVHARASEAEREGRAMKERLMEIYREWCREDGTRLSSVRTLGKRRTPAVNRAFPLAVRQSLPHLDPFA